MANGHQPKTPGSWAVGVERDAKTQREEAGMLTDGEQRHYNYTGRDQTSRLGHCEQSFLSGHSVISSK